MRSSNISMYRIVIVTLILISVSFIGDAFTNNRWSLKSSNGMQTHRMLHSSEFSENAVDLKNEVYRIIRFTATTTAAFAFISILNVDCSPTTSATAMNNLFLPPAASARNLPVSNGASGANRGTAATLVPIIRLKSGVDTALLQLPNIAECQKIFSKIPLLEKDFKKVFDEHSEGVSYKQQFLDQNAFLVYYTKGFDGPGRPSIEAEDSSSIKEKGQFGARNDAWVAVDDARGEIQYLLEYKSDKINTKDLKKALTTASKALADYLSYDTAELVSEAADLALKAD